MTTQTLVAQHKKSERTGRILDSMMDNQGVRMFWFEQDFYQDGTASGWKYLNELNSPDLNGKELVTNDNA